MLINLFFACYALILGFFLNFFIELNVQINIFRNKFERWKKKRCSFLFVVESDFFFQASQVAEGAQKRKTQKKVKRKSKGIDEKEKEDEDRETVKIEKTTWVDVIFLLLHSAIGICVCAFVVIDEHSIHKIRITPRPNYTIFL